MCPFAVCAEIDPVALLNQARAKIVENNRRLPKYTCVQTVHRSRFEAIPSVQASGCGYLRDPQVEPRLALAWTDRFKLDVTVSAGAEIFSWVGARHFQSEDVDKIVGGGMTGTGDFGPFLISIFSGNGSEYEYLGLAQEHGRTFAKYRYRVPLAVSHYQVKVGPRPADQATMAYEGTFWIDPENAELSHMTIEVPNPPRQAEMCRVETTIDYRKGRIGSSDFLLPRLTVLKMWDAGTERSENRIEYTACREFQTESVFRTDSEVSAGDSAVPQKSIAVPPGIAIKIALRSIIDSESSFAGDAIEGQLLNAIRVHGSVLVPAGAVAHGRIVRFGRQYQPSNYFVVGLKFDSFEVSGWEVPVTLERINLSKTDRILGGPMDTREGIGTFMFQDERLTLNSKFVTEWKTQNRSQ
ncbi:MAG: hypothetical protein ABSG65_28180 [Bryobacteraceae bacterium]|jgi:hypothetical protein